MWKPMEKILRRLFGPSDRTANDLAGMEARELRDLGIGAGEIDFVLAGGCRGQDAYRQQTRSQQSTDPPRTEECLAGMRRTASANLRQPQSRVRRHHFIDVFRGTGA